MNKEIWKDILDFEWLYQVSNLGNIKSLNYNRTWKEQFLKPRLTKWWYGYVGLCSSKLKKSYRINRLVWQAFIWLNINNVKMFVCHKDDNPLNNSVDNLFLGTCKDNMQDCANKWRTPMYWKWITWKYHPNSKEVGQYAIDWVLIRCWENAAMAQDKLNINFRWISNSCLWKQRTAWGFIWKYV